MNVSKEEIMINNIDDYIEKGDIELVAIALIEAFDLYHNDKSIQHIKNIFGDYFSELDRVNDFMTQIELNFFVQLNNDANKKYFMQKVIVDAVSKYSRDLNHHETLLSLLDFSLFAQTSRITTYVYRIWTQLESIGFRDKENRAFALQILRYMASVKNIDMSFDFANNVLNSKNFHMDFAALCLIVMTEKDTMWLPRLLDIFTEKGWRDKESNRFFIMLIKNLFREVGFMKIMQVLNDVSDKSFWFVEYLLGIKNMSVTLHEENYGEYKVTFKNSYITYDQFKISAKLEESLIKYLHIDIEKDKVEVELENKEEKILSIYDFIHEYDYRREYVYL